MNHARTLLLLKGLVDYYVNRGTIEISRSAVALDSAGSQLVVQNQAVARAISVDTPCITMASLPEAITDPKKTSLVWDSSAMMTLCSDAAAAIENAHRTAVMERDDRKSMEDQISNMTSRIRELTLEIAATRAQLSAAYGRGAVVLRDTAEIYMQTVSRAHELGKRGEGESLREFIERQNRTMKTLIDVIFGCVREGKLPVGEFCTEEEAARNTDKVIEIMAEFTPERVAFLPVTERLQPEDFANSPIQAPDESTERPWDKPGPGEDPV